jgi:hypothetical protein
MARATLNAMLQQLSGKVGNAVWVRSREGQIVRQRVTPENPDTPAQIAARGRLTTVTQIFRGFTPAQEAAWEAYAETLPERDPVTGKSTVRTAINAFVALATKYLQATPGGTVPTTPPTTPFAGENITLTATAAAGKVTFTASAPNSLGVKTELLLQRLATQNRNPQKGAYRSKAFVAFALGSLSFDVNVPAGWYAAGYRFVKLNTGQATDLVPIGVSQVTLSLASGSTGSKKKAA